MKTATKPKAAKGNIKLYFHETSGGAKYLFDTFIKCPNGHKEGRIADQTRYVVRIDGDITKDAELTVREVEPARIIVTVEGGVVQAINGIPAGVIVEVKDYDVEGSDGEELEKDADGDEYSLATYEGGK